MRKSLSILLVFVMIICLSAPVFSATITAPDIVYVGNNIIVTIVCDNGAGQTAQVVWNINGNIQTTPATKVGVGVWTGSLTVTAPQIGTYTIDADVIKYTGKGEVQSTEVAETVTTIVQEPKPIDTTAPAITWDPLNPTPNANGWYNKPVILYYSLNDGTGAGVDTTKSTMGPLVFNNEGINQTMNVEAYDLATPANHATYTSPIINIDLTPPTITGTANRVANAAGWYNNDVVVSFDSLDSLSGIESSTVPVTLGEGADQSVTGTAVDKAGNSASYAVSGINIDKTAPIITGSADRAANALGWYNNDVIVSFVSSDALSGIASSTTPVTLGEGRNQSVTGTAVDNAGNSASFTVPEINIDKTAPTIVLNGIIDGGYYQKGTALSWNSADTLSGPDAAARGIFDTTTLGIHNVTVTARDLAGNTYTSDISYTVYDFSGILQPLNVDGSSVYKLGSTIPVKFQLGNSPDLSYLTNCKIFVERLPGSNVSAAINETVVSSGSANTDNYFRYDPTSNQYIYNLSTKGSGFYVSSASYKITIKIGDTQIGSVTFGLR